MIMRPNFARPVEALSFKHRHNRYPQSEEGPPTPAKNPIIMSQAQQCNARTANRVDDSQLPSPEDEFVVHELERLADERNIADILEYGFLNGSSCIRVSLSPRGVLRGSVIGDFNNLSLESYAQNPSLMDRLKRRANKGPMVITSED